MTQCVTQLRAAATGANAAWVHTVVLAKEAQGDCDGVRCTPRGECASVCDMQSDALFDMGCDTDAGARATGWREGRGDKTRKIGRKTRGDGVWSEERGGRWAERKEWSDMGEKTTPLPRRRIYHLLAT